MANDNTPSIAQQFTGLPMADLIGGPLMAVTEANSNMAKAQTKFLLETCFQIDKENSDNLKPIMIKLNLTRAVLSFDKDKKPDTAYVTTTIELPILTIIPINSLGVDSASVNFEMEVKSSS